MDAFTGEIRILPYTFAPQNWADCNGQQFGIYQNQALYAVIGQYYGYDSVNQRFSVPDLRGQVAMGTGAGPGLTPRTIAQKTGAESVTLNINQMGTHTHTITVKTVASAPGSNMTAIPTATSWLSRVVQVSGTSITNILAYTPSGTPDVTLASQVFDSAGTASPTPHENRQPYLPMRFCICLNGFFPINPGA
ncbi:MAG: phage tail protein [Methylobacter sp.]